MIFSSNFKRFFLLSSLLFCVIFIVENLNHRFWLNDFKVYYLAAQSFIENKQIYGLPFGLGTGFYKYSPFNLLVFSPFALMPYNLASSIYFFIVAGSLILLIKNLSKILDFFNLYKEGKYTYLLQFSVLLSGISHVVRELHLGNTNAILLLCLTLSIKNVLESKPRAGALFLAFAIICKPYFLILLLPLFLHKKIKMLFYTGVFVFPALLLPAVFIGFSKNMHLHIEWIRAMLAHDTYLESSHTLWSLIRFYFGFSLPPIIIYSICFFLLMLYFVYFQFNKMAAFREEKQEIVKSRNLVVQYFLLVGIIPNLLTTDTEHFLLSLPLIAFLLFGIRNWTIYKAILLIVLFVFYGCNSTDFFGRKLSNLFEVWGFTGLSNLVILVVVANMFSINAFKDRNFIKS